MQSKLGVLKRSLLVGALTVAPIAMVVANVGQTSAAPNDDVCVIATSVSNPTIISKQGNCASEAPQGTPTPTPTQTVPAINFDTISWIAQSPTDDSWSAFASNGTGNILYAAKGTNAVPQRTINGGATWETMPSAGAAGYLIASSSKNGTNAILASQNGKLKYTNDFGATWLDTNAGALGAGTGNWYAAAISGDGQTAVAGNTGGKLYLSKDGAKTWTATSLPNIGWRGATISDDGSRIVVGSNSGRTFTSSDGGVTWATNGANNNLIVYAEMDSTSDGRTVYAIRNINSLFVSNDYGVTFTPVTSASVPTSDLRDVSVSDDGSKIVVGTFQNGIYTSVDSGVTWKQQTGTPTTGAWIGVASSADGSKIVSGKSIGKIFIGKFGV